MCNTKQAGNVTYAVFLPDALENCGNQRSDFLDRLPLPLSSSLKNVDALTQAKFWTGCAVISTSLVLLGVVKCGFDTGALTKATQRILLGFAGLILLGDQILFLILVSHYASYRYTSYDYLVDPPPGFVALAGQEADYSLYISIVISLLGTLAALIELAFMISSFKPEELNLLQDSPHIQ